MIPVATAKRTRGPSLRAFALSGSVIGGIKGRILGKQKDQGCPAKRGSSVVESIADAAEVSKLRLLA